MVRTNPGSVVGTAAAPPAAPAGDARVVVAAPATVRGRGLLLLTVSLGGVVAPLNSTMLAVALPEIRTAFGVSHAQVSWLVSAYLIAMAVAQPLGGRIGDQLGRARVFRLGLASFLGFSLAAALAPSFPLLVVFRTGQALTGAAAIPNGMAMLRETVPVNQLGRSMGVTGAAMSISAAVGPVLGAALLSLGSWHGIFLVNLPLVVIALACQAALRYPDRAARRRLEVDWTGAAAYAGLLVLLTLVLNALRGGRHLDTLALEATALAACTVVFVLRQRTGAPPLAEWRLFRDRSYTASTAYILLSNLVMYTTLLTIPFFIREVQHKGSSTAGLLLGAMSLLMAALAPLAGQIADARGRRLPAQAGSLVAVVAVVLVLAGLRPAVGVGYLALCLGVLGLGVGLSTGPAGTAAVEAAPRDLAGAAAGTNSMMRYLGSIVGAGILGAVLNSGTAAPGIGVFRLIFAILLVVAALAAAAAAFIHRFPPERT